VNSVGLAELVVIAAIGLVVLAVPVTAVVLLVRSQRGGSGSSENKPNDTR
jgi:hypothetical protein